MGLELHAHSALGFRTQDLLDGGSKGKTEDLAQNASADWVEESKRVGILKKEQHAADQRDGENEHHKSGSKIMHLMS